MWRSRSTPPGGLYEEARRNVEFASDDADCERRVGDHTTGTLRAAEGLASLRALEAVVDAVRAGEYGYPENTERVVTAREDAVAALEVPWSTGSAGVSAEVSAPAREAVPDVVTSVVEALEDGG